MKKMLFGLLALSLSASIFAATETATMQVQAQLEVVPATADLVIENLTGASSWNVVASPISFDHGKVVKGATDVPFPVLNEDFRVRRADNSPLNTADGTLTIGIGATTHTSSAVGNLTLSGTATGSDTLTISHEFRTIPNPATIDANRTTPVSFNIESRVDNLAGTEAAGTFRRSETVTVAIN